jgi:hypothetical protein
MRMRRRSGCMMMTFRRECDALIGKKASKVRRLIKVRA